MSPILDSFLKDAFRLSSEAKEYVNRLTNQNATQGELKPNDVHSLYQVIHTLKGTAGMIRGAEQIATLLHDLEGKLACQPISESARNPGSWLSTAQGSIDQVCRSLAAQSHGQEMSSQETSKKTPAQSTSRQGLLVQAELEEGVKLLWIPLSMITKVLTPKELGHCEVVLLENTWVPVIGLGRLGGSGIALQSEYGQAVVVVRDIIGVTDWRDASSQGATQGMRLFINHSLEAA